MKCLDKCLGWNIGIICWTIDKRCVTNSRICYDVRGETRIIWLYAILVSDSILIFISFINFLFVISIAVDATAVSTRPNTLWRKWFFGIKHGGNLDPKHHSHSHGRTANYLMIIFPDKLQWKTVVRRSWDLDNPLHLLISFTHSKSRIIQTLEHSNVYLSSGKKLLAGQGREYKVLTSLSKLFANIEH